MSGERPITVGAVAYHPRVVTIWERFLEHFARLGVPTDYVLFSNYERQVDELLAGTIDIAWNTNTAFVEVERCLGEQARILGMRDIDATFASVIVTPRSQTPADVRELAGQQLALGSRDSGHAAILPLHYLAQQGLDATTACELVRFDLDLGKHGDTGESELRVVEAVARGDAQAGALGDATWARFRSEGLPVTQELQVAWRSPTYNHCNFTVLPSFDADLAERWQEALLAMSHADETMRQAMDLEGVREWLPGERSGYASLHDALATA